MPKRRVRDSDVLEPDEESTPRKTRRTSTRNDGAQPDPPSQQQQAETPSGRKSILKGTPSKANGKGIASVEPTSKSLRKVLFSTPNRAAEVVQNGDGEETPDGTPDGTAKRNDLSARRKSARVLRLRAEDGGSGDEEEFGREREEEFARRVLDEDDGGESDDDDGEEITVAGGAAAPDTPSKRGRGRPKGRKRERTPSPPPDLPAHELYFFQNRAGANKTSANALPSSLLLHHEEYFKRIQAHEDSHAAEIERLREYHERAFGQWGFEMEEGFSLCLYGYGSKRGLVMGFAEFLHEERGTEIVVVNGYAPGLTLKDVLTTLAGVVMGKGAKLPAQPPAMLDLLLSHLADEPQGRRNILIIHSLDHPNLRKAQALLARLASSPNISLFATVDNPSFPLLWDTSLLRQFNWLFHDATTYQPYDAEMDVVESVNELLGRSGRRLGGKDGVAFVLKSLPENARGLFRILVAEQLALIGDGEAAPALAVGGDESEEEMLGASDDERAAEQQDTPSRRNRKGRPPKRASKPKSTPQAAVPAVVEGVEYRTLYHKAVEEFVCTSELNFRTLLKEFYDHRMVESVRDAGGVERLRVPFGGEELGQILEELV